jgi:DNA repair protein RadC
MPEVRLNETGYHVQAKIKNLLFDEQPREKLANYGPETLTDAELLAILLRSGTTEMNVLDTSRMLIENHGGFTKLARSNWKELCSIKGIGKVKALTLLAAFEIGRRMNADFGDEEIILTQPTAVYKFFGPRLRDLDKEVFIVAYLNNSKRLIGYDKVSIGSSNATIVDNSEIFRLAILNKAMSLVLVHNHPSGNTNPSQADIRLTKKLKDTGLLVGIPVVDHVIICGAKFYSFVENGTL